MRPVNRPTGVRRLFVGAQILLLLTLAAPAPILAVGAGAAGLPDKDFRAGAIQPSSTQISRAGQLGATVRWNRFGTPQSLINHGGWLGAGLNGAPETAARSWIRTNRTLFRLSEVDVANLEVVGSNPIGAGRAVLFRQRYGNLDAAQDGLIAVGIKSG